MADKIKVGRITQKEGPVARPVLRFFYWFVPLPSVSPHFRMLFCLLCIITDFMTLM